MDLRGYSSRDIDLTNEDAVMSLAPEFDLQTAVIMCSMVKKEFGDNLDNYEKNVAMAVNLARALGKNPVKRFIYLSSTAVYGEDVTNTSITEASNVCPTSYYGMAKYASERLLEKVVGSNKNSSLVCVRPPLIYGPEDNSSVYGPVSFVKKAVNGETITLWGDGTELREFLFIDDFVTIVGRLLSSDYDGAINVVSGHSYTFKEALDVISKISGSRLNVNSRERSKNKADHAFDNKGMLSLLPELKFTKLEPGLLKIYEYESQQSKVLSSRKG